MQQKEEAPACREPTLLELLQRPETARVLHRPRRAGRRVVVRAVGRPHPEDALMDAEPGTPEGEELDVLTDLVEHHEEKHVPMGYPSAVAAIEFRLEQAGLTQRDLVPFIGSRAKVSEVLSGKRQITMPMARALHEHLGIPAEVLLQGQGMSREGPLASVEWDRFPVRAMAKAGWFPRVRSRESRAQELMGDLIRRAGGPAVAAAALSRKNEYACANAKTDPYALKAWCWKVLADANEARPPVSYRPGTITPDFLGQVARLSWTDEGPRELRWWSSVTCREPTSTARR